MAGFDDKVLQNLVEGGEGGGQAAGWRGIVAESIENVGQVGRVEELTAVALAGARFRHVGDVALIEGCRFAGP